MKRARLPSQKILKEFFDYDRRGFFIRKKKASVASKVGDIVKGSLHHLGYMNVKFKDRTFLFHRLVWQWHFGKINFDLDHINRIRTDNRIENLRPATSFENALNQKIHSRNTSGVRGLYFDKCDKIWYGSAKINGVRHKTGGSKSKELAAEKLKAFQKEHHGEFHVRN